MLDLPGASTLPEGFTPETGADAEAQARQMIEAMASDWRWRMTSGALYIIKVKTSEDPEDTATTAVPFRPKPAQLRLMDSLWYRNLVLKARQIGFTTLIVLMGFDHALWNANQNVTIQAHTEPDAEEIFRDKIRFAYDNLPEFLKAAFPLAKDTGSQLVFGHNGSSIRVVVSARSGTSHFLHVSEMGKVAAKFPDKSREIVTGSLPAVPLRGLAFIESTAEGQGGDFYDLATKAEAKWRAGATLAPMDWRFHFFAWYDEAGYALPRDEAQRVVMSAKDHAYFDRVEDEMGIILTLGQRAWYVAMRDAMPGGDEMMWREYPSTPAECWQRSNEGRYLHHVLLKARREKRIGQFPVLSDRPLNGFWDLGASDTQTLWLHQKVDIWHQFPAYRESNSEGILPFVQWVESFGAPVGTMYLPHDASHLVNGIETPTSLLSQCIALKPSWRWVVVPRVRTIQHGIDLLRQAFALYRFDEEGTKEGLVHCANYKRHWNKTLQAWGDEPDHDAASHAVDALRQHAQGWEEEIAPVKPRHANRLSGMVA